MMLAAHPIDKQRTSVVLAFLRIPLIVGVVLIHSNLLVWANLWYGHEIDVPWWSSTFIKGLNFLASSTVNPMFFAISGYLFFWNIEQFSFSVYKRKLHSRLFTLLIPYLLWNLIAYLYQLTKVYLGIGSAVEGCENILSLSVFLKAFWQFGNEGPADMPLWFVRDLILLVILTPLIHWLLTGIKRWFYLAIVLMACLMEYGDIDWLPLFFFSLGAALSILRVDFLLRNKWLGRLAIFIVLLTLGIYCFADNLPIWANLLASFACMMALDYIVVKNVDKLDKHETAIRKLSQNTFFVYACHGLVVGMVAKVMMRLLPMDWGLGVLSAYVLTCLLTLFLVLGVSYVLKRIFPSLASLLNGKRHF